MVLAETHIGAGQDHGAALTDQDIAGNYLLAGKLLNPKILGV